MTNPFISVEQAIEDYRNGRMVIIVDDEDRENEGDLCIPAQMATPNAINFMATFGRGLICLALTEERVEALSLPFMSTHNQTRHQTAFTVSIEAKEGISTGISASDRARTIAVAIDPEKTRDDLATPGHVFPLMARRGGVLVRAGHTEASVDLAKLAGINPSAVICEIMNDDGTMARLDDLTVFAKKHDLPILKIADLIAYRRKHDHLIKRVYETEITTEAAGLCKLILYKSILEPHVEHIALIKTKAGAETFSQPVHVRMHALNILNDVIGDVYYHKDYNCQKALEYINKIGEGVMVILRESVPQSLSHRLEEREGHNQPLKTPNLRTYGLGAQILVDLGIEEMILISNHEKNIIGLDGYGLKVVNYKTIA